MSIIFMFIYILSWVDCFLFFNESPWELIIIKAGE